MARRLILLIDPQPHRRLRFSNHLRACGFLTLLAGGTGEAVDILRLLRVDMIVAPRSVTELPPPPTPALILRYAVGSDTETRSGGDPHSPEELVAAIRATREFEP